MKTCPAMSESNVVLKPGSYRAKIPILVKMTCVQERSNARLNPASGPGWKCGETMMLRGSASARPAVTTRGAHFRRVRSPRGSLGLPRTDRSTAAHESDFDGVVP